MRALRSATAALVAAFIVLLPSAAQADVLVRYDHGHDVRYFMIRDFEDTGSAPGRAIGDIVRMRIAHEGSSLRVSLQYRALPAAGKEQLHEFRFVTPSGEWRLQLFGTPGDWQGYSFMYDPKEFGLGSSCSTQTHLIDYANARVIVNVPRSCLGYPTFVKVGARSRIQAPDRYYYDSAQIEGGPDDSFPLAPGVYR